MLSRPRVTPKKSIFWFHFKILLLVIVCVNLLLFHYRSKTKTVRTFISCTKDNCLPITVDKNSSQDVSLKSFDSLRNLSTLKINAGPLQYSHCFCSNIQQNQSHNTSQECSFIFDRSVLIHQPPLIPHLQKPPCLLMDEWLLHIPPVYSVTLTVWNQEKLIDQTLHALLNYTHEWWELVVVFDQCHDESISIVENITKTFLSQCNEPTNCPNHHLVHIRLINQISGVSETTSNNIGMRASHENTSYFILVQDDIVVRQDSWNSILAIPMRLWADVFSVSGRCGHRYWSGSSEDFVGRCGKDINRPLQMSCDARSAFYVRDTCNRGPLLLHAARTRTLGYLDEKNYWLGDDVHDLNFRAYASNRWVAGFQPMDFDAPLEFGGSRRKINVPMTAEEIQYRELRLAQANHRISAVNKFRSRQWKKKNVTIVLGPDHLSINFHIYMKDKKNFDDLARRHAETRRISSDILKCQE